MSARFLMTDPAQYEVRYAINPWMRPAEWLPDADSHRRRARQAWEGLRAALRKAGAGVEIVRGAPGWPDMVFPANAAVVLDGRVLTARFRHAERRGEEPAFRAALDRLVDKGWLDEVADPPPGLVQEGAGDCLWDATRQLFWVGHGQRSDRAAAEVIAAHFGQEVVALELASQRFYHLDTCFCPLSGGEVLFYPPAFTAEALRRIRDAVAPHLLIEATPGEAARFCVNAVNFGRAVVMAEATTRLRAVLAERGYRLVEVDLSPFILSGGGAFCMTLRLDLSAAAAPALARSVSQGGFR